MRARTLATGVDQLAFNHPVAPHVPVNEAAMSNRADTAASVGPDPFFGRKRYQNYLGKVVGGAYPYTSGGKCSLDDLMVSIE